MEIFSGFRQCGNNTAGFQGSEYTPLPIQHMDPAAKDQHRTITVCPHQRESRFLRCDKALLKAQLIMIPGLQNIFSFIDMRGSAIRPGTVFIFV